MTTPDPGPPPGEQRPIPAYAPPPPYGYGPPAPYDAQAPPTTHPLAVTSLVLGTIGLGCVLLTPFVGVTLLGLVFSPIAIWLGAWSKRMINREPYRYTGAGIATGGLIAGIVGLVLGVLLIILLALFALLAWGMLVAIFGGMFQGG